MPCFSILLDAILNVKWGWRLRLLSEVKLVRDLQEYIGYWLKGAACKDVLESQTINSHRGINVSLINRNGFLVCKNLPLAKALKRKERCSSKTTKECTSKDVLQTRSICKSLESSMGKRKLRKNQNNKRLPLHRVW